MGFPKTAYWSIEVLSKLRKKLLGTLPESSSEQNPQKQSHPTPEVTPYELIGKEPGTRRLAETFYDIMESAPEAMELLAIHPQPMDSIRQRFFEYLSGWLGGPPLFESQYGHPRLRARHLPFKVTPQMRDQWMFCMNKALDLTIDNIQLREGLRQSFSQLAEHMINCPNKI